MGRVVPFGKISLKMLIIGMSGTGKSSALEILGEHGHRVEDTDTDEWSQWTRLPDGSSDWIWCEEVIRELLVGHQRGKRFVAGCKSNGCGSSEGKNKHTCARCVGVSTSQEFPRFQRLSGRRLPCPTFGAPHQ